MYTYEIQTSRIDSYIFLLKGPPRQVHFLQLRRSMIHIQKACPIVSKTAITAWVLLLEIKYLYFGGRNNQAPLVMDFLNFLMARRAGELNASLGF